MKNVAITPASILWLPDNGETRQIAGMDNGRLNHPVLVLSNPDIERQSSTSANIQILIITSFKGTPLAEKFQHPGARRIRNEYLPLKRSPPEPHPDSGIMLEVRVTGKPQVPKNRQSYVHITTPNLVANHHLDGLLNGTARLSSEAFDLVLTKLEELHPSVVVWKKAVTKKPKRVILLPAPPLRLPPPPPPPTIIPKTKSKTLEDEAETQRRTWILSQQLASSRHRSAEPEPVKPSNRYVTRSSDLSTTSGPSGTTSQNATLLDAARSSHYTRPTTVTPARTKYGTLSSPGPSSTPIIQKPNYTPYTNISTTPNYPRYATPYNHSPRLETGGYTRDDDCRAGCCTVISGCLFFMAIVGGILYFNGYLV